jgi:hypothetical protein
MNRSANCTPLIAPTWKPTRYESGRAPQAKYQLLVRWLPDPDQQHERREFRAPLSRVAFSSQPTLSLPSHVYNLGQPPTRARVAHHTAYTLTLTLALSPYQRRRRVDELEAMLRYTMGTPTSAGLEGYLDVLVLDEQAQVVQWRVYRGPRCWRLNRTVDPDPAAVATYGDEVTFTNADS